MAPEDTQSGPSPSPALNRQPRYWGREKPAASAAETCHRVTRIARTAAEGFSRGNSNRVGPLPVSPVGKGSPLHIDKSGPPQELIRPERHVVLVAPEIHWNTGNIGRTCLAVGARLHLIRPLGFSLESREVKRAGLDYWDQVNVRVWERFEDLLEGLRPEAGEVAFFSKAGARPFWDMPLETRMFLFFGSETKGLPEAILGLFPRAVYHIPITSQTRSLNLSTVVGIALYESLRQSPPFHVWR
jgi:tRNA (cytidine/uridine-2'-O-)-methyltransferase